MFRFFYISQSSMYFLLSPLFIWAVIGSYATAEEYRTINGTYNNIENNSMEPDTFKWGSTDTQLYRLVNPDYDDKSSPSGADRPNPRTISNTVFAQSGSIEEPSGASAMLFQWGQFLDHDLDLTEAAYPPEPFHISVLDGDSVFPEGAVIPLFRSVYDKDTGTMTGNPRQQINQITAFIDASNVYGSDETRASALRTNDGTGRLKNSQWNLLPFNKDELPNAPSTDHRFYLAGDVRANEQVALAAMHTLWMREHNRQAKIIAVNYPGLSGDDIYQKARARVGALMQVITYNEFLPLLLGSNALPSYPGYDSQVNPGIANEFSTAAYRFGHSTLNPIIYRLKKNGQPIPEGNLPLRKAFFVKDPMSPDESKNIDPLMRGLALKVCQKIDTYVVDGVRNFLFGDPAAGGLDLVSLNIQRGRDHGLPSYTQVRNGLSLSAINDFADISSDPDVQTRLAAAYEDEVDLIDLWVGGLAEDRVPGALVGPTFRAILIDQFTRLRDGDRFWYENVFSGDELAELKNTRLSDVIIRNTGIRRGEIPDNVFIAP